MDWATDHDLRLAEQTAALVRAAAGRFREGDSGDAMAIVNELVEIVVDMDPVRFLQLSPQSMVSFIEIAGTNDRVVANLAEAIELQADVLDVSGAIIEGRVRREQANALRDSMNPAKAN